MDNEILERILTEVTEMRGDITEMRGDITDLQNGQSKLEKEISKVRDLAESTHDAVLRIENVELPRLQAALDGTVSNRETIEKHTVQIHSLEKITERHTLELIALKQA